MNANASRDPGAPSPPALPADPALVREATFRVATYNVENYLDGTAHKGRVKSAASKAKVCESIAAINPDVLALQEMGGVDVLHELRAALKARGVDFPHWEHVSGSDADLHVAILSKFPFTARRPHTSESFVLNGLSFRSRRGFAEVEMQLSPTFSLTLLAVHLKSRNYLAEARETDFRLEEAKLLRAIIEARLASPSTQNLIVLGDFNDPADSAVVKTVVGGGEPQLLDLRPPEHRGGLPPATGLVPASPSAAWTHYYPEKHERNRIDFVLISRALTEHWLPQQSFTLAMPKWNVASDHRPIVAAFRYQPGL